MSGLSAFDGCSYFGRGKKARFVLVVFLAFLVVDCIGCLVFFSELHRNEPLLARGASNHSGAIDAGPAVSILHRHHETSFIVLWTR